MAKKIWYKSKTVWINGLALIGGVLTMISADMATGATLTAGSIINIILRAVSKTQITN